MSAAHSSSESSSIPKSVIPFSDTSALPYCSAYVLVVVGFLLARLGGLGYWFIPAVVFVLVPILDAVVGVDWSNPNKEVTRDLDKRISFRLVTWVWVPLQIMIMLWGAHLISHRSLTPFEFVGFILTSGIATGGLGINIAHELIHKSSPFEQNLGKILLVTVCYGQFYVEHLWGHHKRVSTVHDPATSRFGENFYKFWWRSVSGSWQSAWHLEFQRLRKNGEKKFSVHNQMMWMTGGSLAFSAILYVLNSSILSVVYFFLQSFVAFTLLELVNYIEHYGLTRKETAPGKFVRVTPMHSWNAGFQMSNYLLFKLQRHSDHHANAGRRYQILRTFKNSPQMPQGYPGMILAALVPPLWFSMMNPRVKEYMKLSEEYERSGIDMFPEATHDVAPAAQNLDHTDVHTD